MSNARGRFCWYELMTTDRNTALPFYTQLLGWGTMDWQAPDDSMPPYTMWANGETMLGGVMDLPEEVKADGTPPTWVIYIATPDNEATVKRAEELGGNVRRPPTVIPTVGRFAILADPQGATFCIFQSDGEVPGHDGPAAVGEFSWHELATTDPDAALRFYSDLFGWVKASAIDSPVGTYQTFGRSADLPLGGLYRMPDAAADGDYWRETNPLFGWLPYVRVGDIHEAVERVRAGGGKVIHGPIEVPSGHLIAHGIDPQGALFALHSTPR